jgi:two-component system, OmpR family, sensor histidine kinase CpxA
MPARFPLYARILCWFFLNIGLLGAGLYLVLRGGSAGEWLIMQQADPRLQSVARLLQQELQPLPREEWSPVLKKYSEAYDMAFAVFGNNGRQLAGDTLTLPERVRARLLERPGPPAFSPQPGNPAGPGGPPPVEFPPQGRPGGPGLPPSGENRPAFPDNPRQPGGGLQSPAPPQPAPPPGRSAVPPPAGAPRPPGQRAGSPGRVPQDVSFPKFLERTVDPKAWWFVIRVPLRTAERPGGTSLVIMTDSLAAGGLLLDFRPWIWGAAGLLVISSLLWLPFVRRITKDISGMKNAAARIAEGKFDVPVPHQRRDELGELAGGINRMAARLSGFVSGQKRFLGDIAHELCTPLARMQMAGAALEQRAPQELKTRIADLTAEVEAMSQLVSELLEFSRAGLAPKSVALSSVPLLPLVEQVAAREGVPAENRSLEIPSGLTVQASAGLLSRAVANVVRNALRYAQPQPQLEIRAARSGNDVLLTIADNGPGVPDAALTNLFDPFFRLDAARDRESGGTGLGLAIVKTCIESCHGTVTARNRPAGGLEVTFRLPAG